MHDEENKKPPPSAQLPLGKQPKCKGIQKPKAETEMLRNVLPNLLGRPGVNGESLEWCTNVVLRL